FGRAKQGSPPRLCLVGLTARRSSSSPTRSRTARHVTGEIRGLGGCIQRRWSQPVAVLPFVQPPADALHHPTPPRPASCRKPPPAAPRRPGLARKSSAMRGRDTRQGVGGSGNKGGG